MTEIANGESGSSVRAKLNLLLASAPILQVANASLADASVIGPSTTIVPNFDGSGGVTFNLIGIGQFATTPIDYKESVKVATTANITLSGEQVIDGVLTSANRVLAVFQNTAAQNGIYVSAAGAWSRSTDADTSGEVTPGMMVPVEEGTVNADLLYTLATNGTITLGTTPLTFTATQVPTGTFVQKTVAGTTYTHVLLDSQRWLDATNAGTKTITIAPQASVNSSVNTEIWIYNRGAGLLTIAPGAAVTITSPSGVLTLPQGYGALIKKTANPNAWVIAQIANTGTGSITFSTTQRVLGRNTAGGGAGEEVTATQLHDWIGSTRGNVLYRNATVWTVLAPGTANQALLTGGAGADPAWGDVLRPTATANLTAGFTGTANNIGTVTTGTTTPNPANGNLQRYVNGGAHTLAPPSVSPGDACQITIQCTNNGSAGTITTSGFTKVTGSSLTTVNGDDFLFFCTVVNGFSLLNVVALQ